MRVGSLGWKDPLEEEMATHSCILPWENPMDKRAGLLKSMGLAAKSQTQLSKRAVHIYIYNL